MENILVKNVPESHPMALLNNGKEEKHNIHRDESKKLVKSVEGHLYDFYYGDINVTVFSNFNQISIYCYYHGYMGGEDLIIYTLQCYIEQLPEEEEEIEYNFRQCPPLQYFKKTKTAFNNTDETNAQWFSKRANNINYFKKKSITKPISETERQNHKERLITKIKNF